MPLPQHAARRWSLPSPATLAVLLIVGYLVVAPLSLIVLGSVRDAPPGAGGSFTWEHLRTIATAPRLGRSLWNTALFAGFSTLIAVPIGTYLAWLVVRTDVAFRRTITVLALAPLVVPGILTTVAWSLILHPRIGLANATSVGLFGVDLVPVDAASLPGMIWADAADSISLPFLLMAAAFRAMDPAYEEAAAAAGADRATVVRQVTLPLLRPALAATTLIVFLKTVDSFDVPVLLGTQAGIRVLATDVYLAMREVPSQPNLGAAYALVYLALTTVGVLLYHRATRAGDRFITVTGRGYRPGRRELGGARRTHLALAAALLGATVLLPYAVIALTSVLPYYAPPTRDLLAGITLDHFRAVLFDTPVMRRALRNNLVAGAGASLVATLLGAAVAWLVVRRRVRGRVLLDVVATIPIAVPGVVLGLALLWLYLSIPLPIYATLWVIGIGYVTAFLPYAVRSATFALTQLDPELEEASAAAGAATRTTLRRVTLPLLAAGLVASFVFILSRTFKVLSLPVLLGGPGNEVLPVVIYDLAQSARYPRLSALGVLLVCFLAVLAVVGHRAVVWLSRGRATAAPFAPIDGADTPTTGRIPPTTGATVEAPPLHPSGVGATRPGPP